MGRLLQAALPLVLIPLLLIGPLAQPVRATAPALPPASVVPPQERYLCEGEPLLAAVHGGAVDAAEIPNTLGDTMPGAFVVLQWRGVSLQLPRTNNAGAPSYSDGRWWWRVVDPDQPEFRQRRGTVESYRCSREPPLPADPGSGRHDAMISANP